MIYLIFSLDSHRYKSVTQNSRNQEAMIVSFSLEDIFFCSKAA